METIQQLPPINERLQGTIWITSEQMWEDIPIGDITSMYIFYDGEVLAQNRYTFREEKNPEHLNRIVTFKVLKPNLLAFDLNNKYTISFVDKNGESYPVLTAYYADDYHLILEGKMKPGTVIRSRRLYPSTMEFIDRDYTKTLTLDGTRWKTYAFIGSSDGEITYYYDDPDDLIINYTFSDNSNILHFDSNYYYFGTADFKARYTITPKSIILHDRKETDAIPPRLALIRDNKLIILRRGFIDMGYLRLPYGNSQ